MTEKLASSSKTLTEMLNFLGLKANVSIKEIDGKTVLSAESDDAGRIIGKRGQTLQNLELLINRIASKNDQSSEWISINVDGYSTRKKSDSKFSRKPLSDRRRPSFSEPGERPSFSERGERPSFSERGERPERNRRPRFEDFSDENDDNLSKMALDAAKEVKRWGDSVTLKALNSHDRRLIHLALKEDSDIKTESTSVEGSETLKSIVISLNSKDKSN